MIYANRQRAIEAAREMNARRPGNANLCAARTVHGWTVIQRTPYSQGSVLEYAEEKGGRPS